MQFTPTTHESYDYIYPRPNIILQLHKQLYSFAQSSIGGTYKKVTVERALAALVKEGYKEGYIVKIGAGRSTAYGKTDKQN